MIFQGIPNRNSMINIFNQNDMNIENSLELSQTPQSLLQDKLQNLQFTNILQNNQESKASFLSQQLVYNYAVFEPKFRQYTRDEWKNVLKVSDKSLISYSELEYNLRAGIPDDLRPKIWFWLSSLTKLERKFKGQYEILKNQPSSSDEQINKDISRTMSTHYYFNDENNDTLDSSINSLESQSFQLSKNSSTDNSSNISRNGSYLSGGNTKIKCQAKNKGQQQMFNILRAYSNIDKELGYVQGMNFLAAHILLSVRSEKYTNFTRSFGNKCNEKTIEEKAFLIFCHVMIDKNWRQTYLPGFVRLHMLVDSLQRQIHPEIQEHFKQIKLDILPTFQQFYLSLFLRDSPVEFGRRFIDLFLHKNEQLIDQIILRLLDIFHDQILTINDGFSCSMFISQEMFKKAYKMSKNDISVLLPLNNTHTKHM